ncbi:hypothetical protein TrCOL_g11878 [Triparma columacea]|uniref:Aspartic peptidase DDI1-type domain-containing protein n=1 Tax=Triparma columacea TaxID=722753 RepID=A0A9W7GE64_9STRA|nr:hypothetical protein TrCOL_g11878 [Triparma columacea]
MSDLNLTIFCESTGMSDQITLPTPAPPPAASGGLDFSSLLGGAAPAAAPAGAAGGFSFDSLLGGAPPPPAGPISRPNMSLDDLMNSNPNPNHFVNLILSKQHENCLKELRFHHPLLANELSSASNEKAAALLWQSYLVKSSISGATRVTESRSKEAQMEARLRANPMDEEANAYFGDKIRLKQVHEQYELMMETFPEAMGKVLMLYINTKINGKEQIAFVDSGAQMTVMSQKCAEKMGILHLVDKRFAGVAVGVGSSKILGKVHLAEMEINGVIFQVTVTVMDDSEGLGDKNMDFLLGLDMLKRHRCSINLHANQLEFTTGGVVTPFLQEYQLPVNKGGTMGFDAEGSNKEIDEAMRRSLKEADEKKEKADDKGDDKGDEQMKDVDAADNEGGGGKRPKQDE